MKKKVLSLALVAMSLVAFNGMAQNKADGNVAAKQESMKCKSARSGRCAAVNPFDGITLTEAQKGKLEELNSRMRLEGAQKGKARKENMLKNDSARVAERRAAKKSYLEEVKAIIGPELYVVFLENMYVNGGEPRRGKAAFRQGKGKKAYGNRRGPVGRGGDCCVNSGCETADKTGK